MKSLRVRTQIIPFPHFVCRKYTDAPCILNVSSFNSAGADSDLRAPGAGGAANSGCGRSSAAQEQREVSRALRSAIYQLMSFCLEEDMHRAALCSASLLTAEFGFVRRAFVYELICKNRLINPTLLLIIANSCGWR
jgi:hypothetical protein